MASQLETLATAVEKIAENPAVQKAAAAAVNDAEQAAAANGNPMWQKIVLTVYALGLLAASVISAARGNPSCPIQNILLNATSSQ